MGFESGWAKVFRDAEVTIPCKDFGAQATPSLAGSSKLKKGSSSGSFYPPWTPTLQPLVVEALPVDMDVDGTVSDGWARSSPAEGTKEGSPVRSLAYLLGSSGANPLPIRPPEMPAMTPPVANVGVSAQNTGDAIAKNADQSTCETCGKAQGMVSPKVTKVYCSDCLEYAKVCLKALKEQQQQLQTMLKHEPAPPTNGTASLKQEDGTASLKQEIVEETPDGSALKEAGHTHIADGAAGVGASPAASSSAQALKLLQRFRRKERLSAALKARQSAGIESHAGSGSHAEDKEADAFDVAPEVQYPQLCKPPVPSETCSADTTFHEDKVTAENRKKLKNKTDRDAHKRRTEGKRMQEQKKQKEPQGNRVQEHCCHSSLQNEAFSGDTTFREDETADHCCIEALLAWINNQSKTQTLYPVMQEESHAALISLVSGTVTLTRCGVEELSSMRTPWGNRACQVEVVAAWSVKNSSFCWKSESWWLGKQGPGNQAENLLLCSTSLLSGAAECNQNLPGNHPALLVDEKYLLVCSFSWTHESTDFSWTHGSTDERGMDESIPSAEYYVIRCPSSVRPRRFATIAPRQPRKLHGKLISDRRVAWKVDLRQVLPLPSPS